VPAAKASRIAELEVSSASRDRRTPANSAVFDSDGSALWVEKRADALQSASDRFVAEIGPGPVFRTARREPECYGPLLTLAVTVRMALSIVVALPAAYAFSRYRFLGDKHLFFWLLNNRMAPAAVFALPFFQRYSAVGVFDTHIAVVLAHCLFSVPSRSGS
jgi:hypothetical protein